MLAKAISTANVRNRSLIWLQASHQIVSFRTSFKSASANSLYELHVRCVLYLLTGFVRVIRKGFYIPGEQSSIVERLCLINATYQMSAEAAGPRMR